MKSYFKQPIFALGLKLPNEPPENQRIDLIDTLPPNIKSGHEP